MSISHIVLYGRWLALPLRSRFQPRITRLRARGYAMLKFVLATCKGATVSIRACDCSIFEDSSGPPFRRIGTLEESDVTVMDAGHPIHEEEVKSRNVQLSTPVPFCINQTAALRNYRMIVSTPRAPAPSSLIDWTSRYTLQGRLSPLQGRPVSVLTREPGSITGTFYHRILRTP